MTNLKLPAAYTPLTEAEQRCTEGGCKPSKLSYAFGRAMRAVGKVFAGKRDEEMDQWYRDNVAYTTYICDGMRSYTLYYNAEGKQITPPPSMNNFCTKVGDFFYRRGDFFYGVADLLFVFGL